MYRTACVLICRSGAAIISYERKWDAVGHILVFLKFDCHLGCHLGCLYRESILEIGIYGIYCFYSISVQIHDMQPYFEEDLMPTKFMQQILYEKK
jgi:hypothetical protein